MQIHYYKAIQKHQEINRANISGLGCQAASSDRVKGQGEKVRL